MRRLDDARNLFFGTNYSFCKNLVCKHYDKCVRSVSNYKFDKNECVSIFTFGNTETPYFKEIDRCNNYIEKNYETEKKSK